MKKKLNIGELKVTSFVTSVEDAHLKNLKGGETLKGGPCNITFDAPCPTFPCQTPPVTGIWCLTDDIQIYKP